MPELPEVDEVRRTLEPFILGQRIARVVIERPDFVRVGEDILREFAGQTIIGLFRHGKKLFITLADGRTMVVHLGMSGRVLCGPAATPVPKHTHVRLLLADGGEVRFCDPRRFGGVWCHATTAEALEAEVVGILGVDALALLPEHLAHWPLASGRIKARLLAQRDVAGLGNIYVDESLWAARLHPMQMVRRINEAQRKALVAAIVKVLGRSIASGGTTLRDYRNASDQPGTFVRRLKAYGRSGLPCRRCKTALARAVIAGRTSVYCPKCQKCR